MDMKERAFTAGGLTPLVGRGRELQRLLELWEQVQQGQSAFVMLDGEAGIGKSRLIREMLNRVSQGTVVSMQIQCRPQFAISALHPFIQMLQHLLQLSVEGSPQQHLEELEALFGNLGLAWEHAHVIGLLLSLPIAENSIVRLFTPERRKEIIFTVLQALFLSRATVQPVLVIIEDSSWAESSLREFLGYLIDRIKQARVLVVLSSRPVHSRFGTAWQEQRSGLRYRQFRLQKLSARSSRLLIKEVARDRVLPEETLQRLVHEAEGVPFLLEEMTRMELEPAPSSSRRRLLFPRSMFLPDLPLPLCELLLARLERLSPRQLALIQLCAVLGCGFNHALLVALSDLDDEDLRRELAELMAAGLLLNRGGARESSYQFRHVLIQETIYRLLDHVVRRDHHQRIAQVMTERFPEVVQVQPEVLANHHAMAGEYAAIQYWTQAGQLARMRSSIEEAVSYLNEALKLLTLFPWPHLEPVQKISQELQLLSALGSLLIQKEGFRSSEVDQLLTRAWELVSRLGDSHPTLELFYWRVCTYHLARSERHLLRGMAEQLVRDGERQRNGEVRALGHRMMAAALLAWGQVRAASEHIEHAEVYARASVVQHRMLEVQHGAVPRLMVVASTLIIYTLLGPNEQAVRSGDEVVGLVEQIGQPHTAVYAFTCLAIACQLRRDVQGALMWADKALELCDKQGLSVWHAWPRFIREWAQFELGYSHEKVTREWQLLNLVRLRHSLKQSRELGIGFGVSYTLGMLAGLYLELGWLQEGLGTVREALRQAEDTGERTCVAELHRLHGEFLRMDGKEWEARSCFHYALFLARKQGAGLFELRAAVSLGRLLRLKKEPGAAWRILKETCNRFDASPAWPAWLDLQESRALLGELEERGQTDELTAWRHIQVHPGILFPPINLSGQVTLVCCRLAGLVALPGQRLDSGDMDELEAIFQRCCLESIRRNGGSVVLRMEEEVIAGFCDPKEQRDAAERAVRAGLLLVRSFQETLHKKSDLLESSVNVKVGIHTLSDPRVLEPITQAEAAKETVRISGLAAPGEVLLDETTWQLLQEVFALEAFGSGSFEGWLSVLPVSPRSGS